MKTRKKKVYKSPIPSEDQEQIALVKWLNFKQIIFYHIPNGGSRNVIEGAKLKRMGVQPGVPDICIPIGRKGYYGLYIELKRSVGGVVSEKQEEWIKKLLGLNYAVYVAEGCEAAINIITRYFEGYG